MDGNGFSSADDERPAPFSSEAGTDRRSSERFRAVCRMARVTRNSDAGLWRVRNISDDGLQLAADEPVTVGEAVEIALSETIKIYGRIVWADRGRCGVAFDSRIDAPATLRALGAEQRAEGYRALRLPIEAEAILVLPNGSHAIDLVDISQQGAGYVCDMPLEPGSDLDLLLPGGDLRRRALVRWAAGNRGGLWFTRPLDRADLESVTRFADGGNRRDDGEAQNRRRSSALGSMLSFVFTLGTGREAKFGGAIYKGRSIRRRSDPEG